MKPEMELLLGSNFHFEMVGTPRGATAAALAATLGAAVLAFLSETVARPWAGGGGAGAPFGTAFLAAGRNAAAAFSAALLISAFRAAADLRFASCCVLSDSVAEGMFFLSLAMNSLREVSEKTKLSFFFSLAGGAFAFAGGAFFGAAASSNFGNVNVGFSWAGAGALGAAAFLGGGVAFTAAFSSSNLGNEKDGKSSF